jgi:hypothetical protein
MATAPKAKHCRRQQTRFETSPISNGVGAVLVPNPNRIVESGKNNQNSADRVDLRALCRVE